MRLPALSTLTGALASRATFARFATLAAAALLAGCGHLGPALSPPPPATDTALPAAAARALKLRWPGLRPIAHASGRLQVDDADDLAVALAPTDPSAGVVVAILVSGSAQDYRIVANSRTIAADCAACTATVAIARHELRVQLTRPADPDIDQITYRFGYRDNADALRLLAVETAQATQPDDPIATHYSSSTNLLTGARVEAIELAPNDASRRRELRSSLAVRAPLAFDAFSFEPGALAAETRRTPAGTFPPAEPLPAAAEAVLRARWPAQALRTRALGTLHEPGPRDAAAVLIAPAGAAPAVALLVARPEGGWELAALSGPVTRDCAACDVQLEIARGTLIVQTRATEGSSTRLRGYQFALIGKSAAQGPRLIGLRSVTTTRPGNGDLHRSVITANLLTGDRLDASDDLVRGKRQHAQHARQTATRPPQALAGFGFDLVGLEP